VAVGIAVAGWALWPLAVGAVVELPQPVSPMTATMPMRARRHANPRVRREVRPRMSAVPILADTAESIALVTLRSL
jgi:hypothetical protein